MFAKQLNHHNHRWIYNVVVVVVVVSGGGGGAHMPNVTKKSEKKVAKNNF